MTSPAKRLKYDGSLDQRQILTKDQLHALYRNEASVVSVRAELVLEGGQPVPHLDITFRAAADKLVIALGLPVDPDGITWPLSFSAWPEEFLRAASIASLKELTGNSLRSGQVSFLCRPEDDYRCRLEELVKGRSCPGFGNYWTVAQLLWRYRFAASALKKGRLLEFACGAGFGAGLLCKTSAGAISYLGMDPDPASLELAGLLNVDEKARFRAASPGDAAEEPFDCILSFETAARAADPEAFLEDLKSRLKPDGRLILGLPCERWHGFHANRGNWSSWNHARIRKFLEPHFHSIEYHRHVRPRFTENAFATGQPEPLEPGEDRSGHEGYLAVLESPRRRRPRRRVVVQRRYARGDALQATPIVHALRNRYPDDLIVVSTDVTEVFMNNPDVDLLMATSSGFRPGTEDVLVNLDVAYENRPHLHILEAYREVARESVDDPRLRLFPNRWDHEAARQLIERKIADWQQVKYLLTVHLCRTPDRSWPADHWVKFLGAAASGGETAIIVVGAGSDMAVNDNDYIVSCVNKADLLTTAALISLSDCLIGPDSSLLHVAAAVGTAAIGLYGMVLPELRIPYGCSQSPILAPVECAGCLKTLPAPVTNPRCKFGNSFCMESISPEMVLARLQSLKTMMPARRWARRLALQQ
jgi:ADP-heptose:LPS heptosyltransferase/2-polyprenyl-3-methyl-5-hydroxy-6-metoxy-1,4-benzoquinol methylase